MIEEPTNTTPKNLTEKIMHRIEDEHLLPQPRWHFSLKNFLFWALWALSVLAGAAAVSASLFTLINSGWEFSNITHKNAISFIIDSVPFLWITAFSFMLLASYVNLRLTKRGYRYPLLGIIGLGILGSLIFGVILFNFGIGDLLERSLGPRIPMHRPIMAIQKNVWINPSQGLLAGEILEIADDSSNFILRTYDGKNWTVNTNFLAGRDMDILKNFKEVRVIGRAVPNEDTFHACRILPWELRGRAPFLPGPERPSPLRIRRIMPSTSTEYERNLESARNSECEGVRPYIFLKQQIDNY
ncbi:MAG: hypothetical protein ABIB04_02800 [Patescibacteria group bacterium]